ncbi:MAG: imidazole glycerol phosphate synthase cyclase subunit [Candidatus Thermoplasmatota archaeon]|nr:imidazole glycerol phosphate synthase cyclase subunit [Candidatus Thermoplasmatota archaeon]
MLKKRLIPVLLLQNGMLVRSEKFRIHQIIGNPILEVKRFNEWNVDELIYLDISQDNSSDYCRNDIKDQGLNDPISIIERVSKTCFMPLTWGGQIKNIEDMKKMFYHGADKITINSAAFRNPSLIKKGAQIFGSQSIVVSIDVIRHMDGSTEVMIDGGSTPTGLKPQDWAREVEKMGAGEILLQSIDRDGTGIGYDLALIQDIATSTTIPVIALGGVGAYSHYAEGIIAGASAVAAANIWHFKELADLGGKKSMKAAGIEVRD